MFGLDIEQNTHRKTNSTAYRHFCTSHLTIVVRFYKCTYLVYDLRQTKAMKFKTTKKKKWWWKNTRCHNNHKARCSWFTKLKIYTHLCEQRKHVFREHSGKTICRRWFLFIFFFFFGFRFFLTRTATEVWMRYSKETSTKTTRRTILSFKNTIDTLFFFIDIYFP